MNYLADKRQNSLIENFKKNYPKVVEELIPDILPLGSVVRVLQNLLKEQISIRDLLTIFETLADSGTANKDTDALTEAVRKSLSRAISAKFQTEEDELKVLTLGSEIEDEITQSLLQTEQGIQLVMDPQRAQTLINEIANKIGGNPEIAGQPILLTSPTVRRHIARLAHRFIPQLIVLSHSEVASDMQVSAVDTVEVGYAG